MGLEILLVALFWFLPMLICMDDIDYHDTPSSRVCLVVSVIPGVNLVVASVICYNRITGRK